MIIIIIADEKIKGLNKQMNDEGIVYIAVIYTCNYYCFLLAIAIESMRNELLIKEIEMKSNNKILRL